MNSTPNTGGRAPKAALGVAGVLAVFGAAAGWWKRRHDREAGPNRATDRDARPTAAEVARLKRHQAARRNSLIRDKARPLVAALTMRYDSANVDIVDAAQAELAATEADLEAAYAAATDDTEVIELEAVVFAHRQARLRARSHTGARGVLDRDERRALEDGVRCAALAAKPGDVWWVEVANDNPDEESPAKVRPAIVVASRAQPCTTVTRYTVTWATTQGKRDGRPGFLATATLGSWPLAETPSWLNLRDTAEVGGLQLRTYVGELNSDDLRTVQIPG